MILQYSWGLKPSEHCFANYGLCLQPIVHSKLFHPKLLEITLTLQFDVVPFWIWGVDCLNRLQCVQRSLEIFLIMIVGCQRTRGVPATLEISYFPSKSQFTTNFCQSPYLFIGTSQAHQLANILPTLLYTETNSANWLIFDQEKLRHSSWFYQHPPTFGQMNLKYIMARIDRICFGFFCTNVLQLVPILIMANTLFLWSCFGQMVHISTSDILSSFILLSLA